MRKLPVIVLIVLFATGVSGCTLPWARQATPAPPARKTDAAQTVRDLIQVSMFYSTAGWGLSESRVLATQDGGATWLDVTPKGLDSLSGATTFFLDAGHAWLAAGVNSALTIFRTTDGGQTWMESRGPEAMGATLRFSDEKAGWLMVHLGAAMSHEEVSVFRTDDGGVTWKPVSHTPVGGDVPGALPLVGIKSGLAVSGQDRVWVTGSWPVPGQPYLFVTRDGGKTWSPVTLPLPKECAEEMMVVEPPVFRTGGEEGVLTVNLYSKERVTLVFSTKDRGETWQFRGKLGSGGDRLFLSVPSPDEIHAFDGEQFYASSDGGKSWTNALPARKLLNVTSVQFVSAQGGWLVGGGQLLKTVDGGKTWSPAGK